MSAKDVIPCRRIEPPAGPDGRFDAFANIVLVVVPGKLDLVYHALLFRRKLADSAGTANVRGRVGAGVLKRRDLLGLGKDAALVVVSVEGR